MASRTRACALLAAALVSGCAVTPYDPYPLTVAPLPADAFERCRACFTARRWPIVEADADAFLLRTDWTPLPCEDAAAQQRAALFKHGRGLGLVVEVRYLRQGWFDGLPKWSAPRADAALERDLGELLAASLRADAAGDDAVR